MQTKGYSGYRGKRRNKKTPMVIVLCVIFALACLFLALQRFIVYDANGGARFVWPGSEKKTEERTQKPVDVEVTKDRKRTITTSRPKDKVIPSELRGLTLTADFFDTPAIEPYSLGEENEGFNTVILCLKEQSGKLRYPSKTQGAIDSGAVETTEFAAANLKALVTSPYYTVAQVYALHDSIFSYANTLQTALLRSDAPESIWYDAHSSFWLDPEKEMAVRYLKAIVAEVAAFGFDEIMLDDFCYPREAEGNSLKTVDTSQRKLSENTALAQLAGELRAAVEPYSAKLSVKLCAEDVIGGGSEASGIVFAELAEIFDRIYVETTAEQAPSLRAAFEGYHADFVPVLREGTVVGNCVYGVS